MYVEPMLLDEVEEPFESDSSHIVEIKIDGIRGIISNDTSTHLFTRHHNEITSRFQEVIQAAHESIRTGIVLDGELVVCDLETGKPDFSATMKRFSSNQPRIATPGLCYIAFDILVYKSKPTFSIPLMERKQLLEDALHENDIIKRMRYFENNFVQLFNKCREEELEGLVFKRKNSKYHPASRPKGVWSRCVVYQRQVCIIIGFSKTSIAWLLGIEKNNGIETIGWLKYGLNIVNAREVFPLLLKTKIRENEHVAFVEPMVRVEVRYRHWTKEGKMRLPVLERVLDWG